MKKILIINNGNKHFNIEIIKPFLSLPNNTYKVDIIQDGIYISYDQILNMSNDYNYLIFHRCIGRDYKKTIDFLKNLNKLNNKMKSIVYINDFWNLPDYHPLYKIYNENNLQNDILNIIRLSNIVISYSLDILEEVIKINKNVAHFENIYINPNTKIDSKLLDKPVFGIVPNDIYDEENIKQLNSIHKTINKKGFYNTVQFVLIGFHINNTLTEFNKMTFETTEIIVQPKDSIWVKYEKIITDNYNICSPEYKNFLLTYLPNDRYNGNINNEPYKRIWYNELNPNILNYNILLEPLVKNKYNKLKFSYERERAKKILTIHGKYIKTIRTDILPKNKKSITRSILDASFDYRQSVMFEDNPYENKFIDNLKFMNI